MMVEYYFKPIYKLFIGRNLSNHYNLNLMANSIADFSNVFLLFLVKDAIITYIGTILRINTILRMRGEANENIQEN